MHVPTNGKTPSDGDILPLQTDLDEEALVQLDALVGKVVLSMTLWTEPLALMVEEDLPPEARDVLKNVVDVDFYFEDHLLLELYNAMVYESEDEAYVKGMDRIARLLIEAVEKGVRLVEIAEEAESGAPIFIFEGTREKNTFLIVADGWIVDVWERLPEEE